MLAAQSISLGHRSAMVAGGFESMSNAPYMSLKARSGLRLGHSTLVDGEAMAWCLWSAMVGGCFRLARVCRGTCQDSLAEADAVHVSFVDDGLKNSPCEQSVQEKGGGL